MKPSVTLLSMLLCPHPSEYDILRDKFIWQTHFARDKTAAG
jgi:hypothetical protein